MGVEEPVSRDEFRTFNQEPLSTQDLANVKAICSALVQKEDLLSVLVANRADYVFSLQEKNCEAEGLSPEMTIVTNLVGEGLYYFRPRVAPNFPFSNVETKTNGIMAAICAEPDMSPLQTSPDTAIWFTTAASKHCKDQPDSVCIHISKGNYNSNGEYKIHTNEWARFKVTGERQGFFTYRKLVSSYVCPEGKNIELRATLK